MCQHRFIIFKHGLLTFVFQWCAAFSPFNCSRCVFVGGSAMPPPMGLFEVTFCHFSAANSGQLVRARSRLATFVSADFVFRSRGVGRGWGRVNHGLLGNGFATCRNVGVIGFLDFIRFREPNSPQSIQNGLLTFIRQWCEAFLLQFAKSHLRVIPPCHRPRVP